MSVMTSTSRGPRTGRRVRETDEVWVEVEVDLDGTGRAEVRTGIAFLDHLLTALARHARIDLKLSARGDLDDHYAHLTNVAVQKKNAEYNENHGGKWSLMNLRLFLESARGAEATSRLFEELDAVILKSLRAVQHVMHNDAHCFELYGYDMLIDDGLKPWLIEVNASPSLSATTEDDCDVKLAVIRDALAVAVPTLPTTTPEAAFATIAASSRDAPARRESASAATAVSPAPCTS